MAWCHCDSEVRSRPLPHWHHVFSTVTTLWHKCFYLGCFCCCYHHNRLSTITIHLPAQNFTLYDWIMSSLAVQWVQLEQMMFLSKYCGLHKSPSSLSLLKSLSLSIKDHPPPPTPPPLIKAWPHINDSPSCGQTPAELTTTLARRRTGLASAVILASASLACTVAWVLLARLSAALTCRHITECKDYTPQWTVTLHANTDSIT